MKVADEKKSRKKVRFIIAAVVTAVVILLFIALTLRYIGNFSDALIEENSSYLAEITEHITVNVGIVIGNMQRSMETVGMTIADVQIQNKDKVYLDNIRERYSFEYVGVALSSGVLRSTMESEEVDISDEDYYRQSMGGESVLKYVPIKIFKDKVISGLIISAPIYNLSVDSETPVGVLVAMLDMKKFADLVYVSGFSGQGSTYIIDGSGEVLMQTKLLDYSNLYTTLENVEFDKGYSLTKMQADLAGKTPGFGIYSSYGVEKFMHYRSLGIADWSVVTVIEKDLITAKTTRLTRELMVLGIAVIILFPLLFIFAISSIAISKANRQAANTKSAFLANMSHEIRTPMNAIVGIGEILLREEMPDKQKNYVMSMVNAGNGLLTIINDILDISKIESGKFSIIEEEYEVESLIHDIVSVIAVRINDKPIRLIVDVDTDLPKYLVGDMIRVKQVLTNIMGNAVKFTESGYIKLGIYGKLKDGQFTLTMPVEDSGIGIHKGDIDKLFGSFTQVDTHRNRSIEGTGLGLAISKQLCEMMGGDITVESSYGKGSTFTIKIVQQVTREEKMIHAPNPEGIRILLLEPSELIRTHFAHCMDRLRLKYVLCEDFEAFFTEVHAGGYTHAVAEPQALHRLADESSKLPEITPVALIRLKDHTNLQDYGYTIIGPLFTLQLAAVLCNEVTHTLLLQRGGIDVMTIKPMPFVRVLLVDDNEVNLQVANGLMTPYHMQVDCVTSGRESIKMAAENDYDLIFMDHMMPEMDGVEAMKIIRTLGDKSSRVPVIALTANVGYGARELFMRSGFSDFLPKPIDTVKLNVILKKWLKDLNEAREKENPAKAQTFYETLSKDGDSGITQKMKEQFENDAYVDFAAGVEKLGDREVYCSILETYRRSAHEKLKELPTLAENDFDRFIIDVHGLKGASGGICATAITAAAAESERLAKAGKQQEVRAGLPALLNLLKATLEEIDSFIAAGGAAEATSPQQPREQREGRISYVELLAIKEAFWKFDSEALKRLFDGYADFDYEEHEQRLLTELAKCYRAYDFETPIGIIEAYEQQDRKE